jgi:hypothetical protein
LLFRDLSVLDVSEVAQREAHERLGESAGALAIDE